MNSLSINENSQAGEGHSTLRQIYTPKQTLSVIGIGAGASGLLLAYKVQRHFDDFTLEIFEKNPEVSGTWYENRYLGGFSNKYGLAEYVKLSSEVIGARWDDHEALWHVKVQNLVTRDALDRTAHVLVNAGGILNSWRFPPIPRIRSFKGLLVHSAAWPKEGLELEGNTVGLIGNGSSEIQILPAIKDKVDKLVTFVREATWVAPPLGVFQDKEVHLDMRKKTEAASNSMFAIFHRGSEQQQNMRQYMESLMRQRLENPELEKVLIPEWSVGCRRLTPGTDYLESLRDDNVQTVFGEITEITPTGIVCSDGKGDYPVNVLICATGFNTTLKPRFPVQGARGCKLENMWRGNC
ncbi:hypothetical protein GGP41_007336 [Bipolaris sorokiniana]|uniref:FAD/NAD(P)-binding domain-containing protein n=1 Tax=Cochliobolus sativus TaxID=45130 RepID=A0A8H5ZQE4_COCSA|nr:hypothetical protein GGP41_007336 [Bipolaris sorokiniana]